MSVELSKCYELLGISPGASAQELKTAHRDMAKVWHPDRFSHDPRLQQKAQEKLKEINEAYDQLVSGKARRQPPSPPPVERNPPSSRSTRFDQHVEPSPQPVSVAVAQRMRWRLVVLPLLIFGAVFFFTSRSLIRQPTQSSVPPAEQRQASPRDEEQPSDSGAASAASELARGKNRVDPSPAKEAKPVDSAAPEPATPSVSSATYSDGHDRSNDRFAGSTRLPDQEPNDLPKRQRTTSILQHLTSAPG